MKARPSQEKDFTGSLDIVDLILHDHQPLKELIEVMKDDEATFREKKEAFLEFAPTLVAHAKPEEQTWYLKMKEGKDMVFEGLEGDVEHGLADQLCEELKRTTDEDLFMAKVKVLAEFVQHHIEEEEEEMLPEFRKKTSSEMRGELGQRYLQLQAEIEEMGSDDAPHERLMRLKSGVTTSDYRH
ncbi:MAG: hemerythrin domain-containing protein [Bdellovibrionaceae bacterium]|nr:hemerythrin domain-containing protein [Pseudobdellovibrionaceae bacterium]